MNKETEQFKKSRLKAAMLEVGIPTRKKLADVSGVSLTEICRISNWQISAINIHGDWTLSALKICKALHAEPEDVFPKHEHLEFTADNISRFVYEKQVVNHEYFLIHPRSELEASEIMDVLNSLLDTLPIKEQNCLRALFVQGYTTTQYARKTNLHRGTIWLRMHSGLRKLRHTARMSKLLELV